uniref:SH2 domain-containing protein n=1 Tax=Anopheles culicifacies TaxID=139723 RepID=A0A182MH15_9DIPT
MLRFGGLKYKKLNNAGYSGDEQEHHSSPTEGNGKRDKSVHSTPTTTPSKQQQRLHNQLNGTAMKNINTSTSEQKRHRNNFMLIVGGLSGKSLPEHESPKSPYHVAVEPSSPSSNFKLLSGKFAIDSKRKINCKTRIYKCIKRILKRNSFHTGTPKEQSRGHRMPASLRTPNAADYREIKSLLEKQHRDLEYDVNLAKCVEKPAFIKKIAINMLQSAVSDEKEDSTLVLHREQTASVTGTIQSDLEREREYQRLLDECWYHENLPRSLSLQLLMDKLPGSFLVRKSTTQPDCYALSLRVPPGSGPRIAHYLIVRTACDGYKIKGFQKEFSSLRALIVHHSVMPEALPVPLAVPRPVNLVVKTKFEDDYETVFDLAKVVQP